MKSPRRQLFSAAGILMLIQVLLIGLRRLGAESIPEYWAAPPAIGSVVTFICGLISLYPLTVDSSPKLSLTSVLSGITAGFILLATSIYLAYIALESGAAPQPLPLVIQGGVALFMVSFISALISGATACLRTRSMRSIGFMLFVPVLLWCVILAAATAITMTEALKLDVFTNGVIALALLAVGFKIRNHNNPMAQPGSLYNSGQSLRD